MKTIKCVSISNSDRVDVKQHIAPAFRGLTSIALLSAAWLVASPAVAGAVEFQFNGIVTQAGGPGSAHLPASITNGAPVSGQVRYQTSGGPLDANPAGNIGDYSFAPGQFSIEATVGIAHVASDPAFGGTVTVHNDNDESPQSDRLTYATGKVRLDGAPLPGAPDSAYLDLDMQTTNLLALASDALPQAAPSLTDFMVWGGFGYRSVSFYTYKNGNYYYGFSASIQTITPAPILRIERSGPNVTLRWPASLSNFGLQFAPTPAGIWQYAEVIPALNGADQVVTLPANQAAQFFRLSKYPD